MSTGVDVREKWKFTGRELVDGVPHLMWKCEAVEAEGRGRHRAEVPDWEWGCAVDDFRQVTVRSAHPEPSGHFTLASKQARLA